MATAKCITACGTLLFLALVVAIALWAKPLEGNSLTAAEKARGIPMFDPGGTALPDGHVVIGHVILAAGLGTTVTLKGPAAFTSASSYACYGDYPGPVGGLQKIDGRQIIIPRISDVSITVRFVCIGN